MQITRHNYESFFILYMDNELSADDRMQVDAFVQLHPDLKEELESLMQYKLIPDSDITYEGKEDLFKETNPSLISASNYDNWLLLYVDNELNAADRAQVAEFVAAHPNVQKDLQLLQRSKLVAEAVSFPGKETLYRKTERSIPVLWYRMAAAVLLIALALSTILIISKNRNVNPGIAGTRPPVQINNSSKEKINSRENGPELVVPKSLVKDEEPVKKERTESPSLPSSKEQLNNNVAVSKNEIAPRTDFPRNNLPVPVQPVKDNDAIASNDNKPSNNLPLPINNNLNNTDTKGVIASTNNPKEEKNAINSGNVTSDGTQPLEYKNASYTSTNNSFGDETTTGKKNKLRGFFRKITRTFEKRTNIDPTTDDSKLLVAGWSINLK